MKKRRLIYYYFLPLVPVDMCQRSADPFFLVSSFPLPYFFLICRTIHKEKYGEEHQ